MASTKKAPAKNKKIRIRNKNTKKQPTKAKAHCSKSVKCHFLTKKTLETLQSFHKQPNEEL